MRLRPTQETKLIVALVEIEAGDALAYRRLRLYTQSAFAVGLLLLGLAVFEAVNKPRAISAALTGTHIMRRTKATMIYRRTKNLRAVQLPLGHTKVESTVRYLGIEVDDALGIAEQTAG